MIGQSIQFNRRNALSFLLAVFMLILVATPALAWFDEGDINGQAARPCRVISDGQETPTVYCYQVTPHHPRPVAEQPLVRPAIARAEEGLFFHQAAAEPLVQSPSDQ
jgi:hypothetical protein